jgi:hypothetical protein
MRLLYLAWLHGGHDPYRLFNRLGDDYRPLEASADGDRPQFRPPNPKRLSHVVYGFATVAFQEAEARAVRAMGGAAG